MREEKSPCETCKRASKCILYSGHRKCEVWRIWFHEQWENIRDFFGRECVDLALEEKECDNE